MDIRNHVEEEGTIAGKVQHYYLTFLDLIKNSPNLSVRMKTIIMERRMQIFDLLLLFMEKNKGFKVRDKTSFLCGLIYVVLKMLENYPKTKEVTKTLISKNFDVNFTTLKKSIEMIESKLNLIKIYSKDNVPAYLNPQTSLFQLVQHLIKKSVRRKFLIYLFDESMIGYNDLDNLSGEKDKIKKFVSSVVNSEISSTISSFVHEDFKENIKLILPELVEREVTVAIRKLIS